MLIDFLFIPEGETHTLGELREINPEKREKAWGSAEEEIVKWFKSKL